MIYDCFTFFNELDLLEIRLNTLAPIVDRFVIAEATRTFRGLLKDLIFEKNRERFADFIQPCDLEYLKRAALFRKLAHAKGVVSRFRSSLIPAPVVRVLSAWRHRPKGWAEHRSEISSHPYQFDRGPCHRP